MSTPPQHDFAGLELGKALRLMQRAFAGSCACGFSLGAHGVAHPHAMASVGCPGMRTNEEES